MADKEGIDNALIIDFFRSRLPELGAESRLKYARTIRSLDDFLAGHSRTLIPLDYDTVADWAATMLMSGLSANSVRQHIDILSALIGAAVKAGLCEPTDLPQQIKAAIDPATPFAAIDARVGDRLSAFVSRAIRQQESPGTDLLLIALLSGARPVGEVAAMKKTAAVDSEIAVIVSRNASPRRSYVFDLNQSQLTPRQLRERAEALVLPLIRTQLLPRAASADEAIRALWLLTAIRCGASPSEALGAIGISHNVAVPPFCRPATIDGTLAGQWHRVVADTLISDPMRWYAMHLRRHATITALRDSLSSAAYAPEIFYPCETISRRLGSATASQPFIPDVVFFRTRRSNIPTIFRTIGDKAWCYRLTAAPGSPYAAIPDDEMRRFQGAIGIFTPDHAIHPIGELTPRPGEKVIVITVGYGDRPATVEDIHTDPHSGTVLFRVRLTTDSGYEWRATLDPRQLLPPTH